MVGGIGAVVVECGQQAVGPAEVAAVGGAGVDLGLDHPKREAADPGQVGAVGQQRQHRRSSGAGGTYQELSPLSCDVCEQFVAIEGTIRQEEHVRGEVAGQVVGVVGLTLGGGAEDRCDQAAGACFAQDHEHQPVGP